MLDWLGKMINLPKSFLPFLEDRDTMVDHLINGNSAESPVSNGNGDIKSEDDEVLVDKTVSSGGGVILVIYSY